MATREGRASKLRFVLSYVYNVPDEILDKIDIDAYADPRLTFAENLELLTRFFPALRQYVEPGTLYEADRYAEEWERFLLDTLQGALAGDEQALETMRAIGFNSPEEFAETLIKDGLLSRREWGEMKHEFGVKEEPERLLHESEVERYARMANEYARELDEKIRKSYEEYIKFQREVADRLRGLLRNMNAEEKARFKELVGRSPDEWYLWLTRQLRQSEPMVPGETISQIYYKIYHTRPSEMVVENVKVHNMTPKEAYEWVRGQINEIASRYMAPEKSKLLEALSELEKAPGKNILGKMLNYIDEKLKVAVRGCPHETLEGYVAKRKFLTCILDKVLSNDSPLVELDLHGHGLHDYVKKRALELAKGEAKREKLPGELATEVHDLVRKFGVAFSEIEKDWPLMYLTYEQIEKIGVNNVPKEVWERGIEFQRAFEDLLGLKKEIDEFRAKLNYEERGEYEFSPKEVEFLRRIVGKALDDIKTIKDTYSEELMEKVMAVSPKEVVVIHRLPLDFHDKTGKEVLAEYDGAKAIANYDDKRVWVVFDHVPPEELRKYLRSKGFLWSPKRKAWVRKLTYNAIHDAVRVLEEYKDLRETGKVKLPERKERPTKTTTESLISQAEKRIETLKRQIEKRREQIANLERLNPTPKRTRQIGQYTEEIMENEKRIALLKSIIERLKSGRPLSPEEELLYKVYVSPRGMKALEIGEWDIKHGKEPRDVLHVRIYKGNAKFLLEKLPRSAKEARAILERVINSPEEYLDLRPEEAEVIMSVIRRSPNRKEIESELKYSWFFSEYPTAIALWKAGVRNYDQWKRLVKDYVAWKERVLSGAPSETMRELEIKRRERELLLSGIPGFFPTPKEVAMRLVEEAPPFNGARVLEPSAGSGNIAEAVREYAKKHGLKIHLDVCEINPSLRELLKLKGFNVVCTDFMKYNPGPIYDRIYMNPPFENNQDIEHVRHAYELLKPGGVLVAITSPHWTFANDKPSREFREWVKDKLVNEFELPPGTFKQSGTNVRAMVIILKKPESTVKEPNYNVRYITPELTKQVEEFAKTAPRDVFAKHLEEQFGVRKEYLYPEKYFERGVCYVSKTPWGYYNVVRRELTGQKMNFVKANYLRDLLEAYFNRFLKEQVEKCGKPTSTEVKELTPEEEQAVVEEKTPWWQKYVENAERILASLGLIEDVTPAIKRRKEVLAKKIKSYIKRIKEGKIDPFRADEMLSSFEHEAIRIGNMARYEKAEAEKVSEACVAEKENLLWQAYEAEFKLKGLKAKKPAWLRELAEKVCREELNLAQALAETLRKAKIDIAEEIYRRVVRKRPVEEVSFEQPGEVEVVEEERAPEEEVEVPVKVHGRVEEVLLEELPELKKRPILPEERSVYERLLRALDKRLAKLGIELDLVLPNIEPELKALAEAVRRGEISFDEAVIRASAMAKRRYEALRKKTTGEVLPEVEVLRKGPKAKTATEIVEGRSEKPRSTFEYLGKVPEWLMEALDNPHELGEMLFYGAGKYLSEKANQYPDAPMYVDFLAKWLSENVIQPTVKRLEREERLMGGLPLRKMVALYVLKNYGGRLASGGVEEAYKYAVSWVKKLLKDCNTPECKFARRFASSHFVCTKIGDLEDVKVTTEELKGYTCMPGWYYLTMTAVVEALRTKGGSEADLPIPYRKEYEKFISAMIERWGRRGR